VPLKLRIVPHLRENILAYLSASRVGNKKEEFCKGIEALGWVSGLVLVPVDVCRKVDMILGLLS
jgi:hypothetical protein